MSEGGMRKPVTPEYNYPYEAFVKVSLESHTLKIQIPVCQAVSFIKHCKYSTTFSTNAIDATKKMKNIFWQVVK